MSYDVQEGKIYNGKITASVHSTFFSWSIFLQQQRELLSSAHVSGPSNHRQQVKPPILLA